MSLFVLEIEEDNQQLSTIDGQCLNNQKKTPTLAENSFLPLLQN